MKNKKLYYVFFLVVILTVMMVAGLGTKSQENVLRLGAALSLSGADARSGEISKRAYDLWKDIVNEAGGIDVDGKKYKIDIVYYDTKSETQTAAKLVEKLIVEDKVQFLLAPFGSASVYASSTISEQYGVPMVSGQGASQIIYERGYKYIFSATADTTDYLRSSFDLAETLTPPIRKVAIIYENELFSGFCADSCKIFAQERNMEVIYFDKYESSTNDLSPALLTIASKKPDMLVVVGWPTTSQIAQRQIKELNLNFPIVVQAFGPAIPTWRESVGDAALYVIAEEQFNVNDESTRDHVFGTAKDYTKAHVARYGYIPTYDDANSAAAALSLQLAIENAGSIERDKVRDALAILDEPTFVGQLKFKPNGSRLNPSLYAVQIQDKDPKKPAVFVFPEAVKEADIVYPMPKFEDRK